MTEGVNVLHVSDLVMVKFPETEGAERVAFERDNEECTIGYEGDTETFTLEEWNPMAGDEPTDDLDELSLAAGVATCREFAMEPHEGGGYFEGTALVPWMEHNSFGVLSANVGGVDRDGFKFVAAASHCAGGALLVAGSATWIGAAAGIDYRSPHSPSILARAELGIPNLSVPRVDIAFTRRADDGVDSSGPASRSQAAASAAARARTGSRAPSAALGLQSSAAPLSAARSSVRMARSAEWGRAIGYSPRTAPSRRSR